jgi:glutathione S-transferase
MWTLYDFLPSGNGYKVRLTLRELGRPFVYRQLDILQGETQLPWFLAKNPLGQIPVLELEDGTCLCESSAILWHIAEGTHLLPSDRLARTRVLQWLCFEQQNVDNVISRARFRRLYPDAVPTRPEEFEPWLKQGARALRVLEQHLRTRTFWSKSASRSPTLDFLRTSIAPLRAASISSHFPRFAPGSRASLPGPDTSESRTCRAERAPRATLLKLDACRVDFGHSW